MWGSERAAAVGGKRGAGRNGQALWAAPGAGRREGPKREGPAEGRSASVGTVLRGSGGAAMPLYEGLGSGGEKTAVVLDLGEAFTK